MIIKILKVFFLILAATFFLIAFVAIAIIPSLISPQAPVQNEPKRQSMPDNIIAYNIAKDYKRVGSLYYDNTVDFLFKTKEIDEICFVNRYADLRKIGKTVSNATEYHIINGVGTAIVLLKNNEEVYFISTIPGGLHDSSNKCYSAPPEN